MTDISEVKKMDDVIIKHETTATVKQNGKTPMPKFMRTCLKCGMNLYSAGEYSRHMKEVHGKAHVKSDIAEPRKVQQTMANTGQDVPEEILVKPKKVETPKAEPAKSRQKRTKKAEPTETPAETPALATESAPAVEQAPEPATEPATAKPRKRRKISPCISC